MITLLVGLALAGECDPAASVNALKSGAAKQDYLCVMDAETGADLVTAALLKDPLGKNERLTRALAIWLLARTDREMDPAMVARLAPSDRRLLADGIRARRGRPSPSPEHLAVFEQFPWYAPVPHYTDGRLRPIDRQNIAIVDPQTRAVAGEPEAAKSAAADGAAVTPRPPSVSADTPNLCGCDSSAGGGPFAVFVGGLALLGVRRRAG